MRAFEVINVNPALPVVVHAPHGGTVIPDEERAAFLLDDAALADEIRLMTDHRTDRLAEAAADLGAVAFVNGLSRLVVDPERFPDEREEMEAAGMGFAYTATSRSAPLRHLAPADRERLKERWFEPYGAALEQLVRAVRDRFGRCVIVDLHSYPRRALPYELRPEALRPEVCIGTDAFHTPEWLAAGVEEACDRLGLGHGRDTPFRGCYVPLGFYRQDAAVSSVMLELRRDVYLDEATGRPNAGEAVATDLVAAVVRIAAEPPG